MPECNAEHHGYELLATIDGTDTKFSCNLAHGLYSWMGAASECEYDGTAPANQPSPEAVPNVLVREGVWV